MPRKGIRSSAKAPAKKAAGAPKPKAKPRGQASALAEVTDAASAAIKLPGASNAPSSTHSRRNRSPDLPPDDLPNPRFAYRDHSPVSPAYPERMLYLGDESDPHDSEGSQLAASPAPAVPASSEGEMRPSPSQADPQAKAVSCAATQHQGAAAAQDETASSRKRSASQSPRRKARDYFRGLSDSSSDDEEKEGAVPEPQEISNDLDGQQERYHAPQLQTSNLPSAQTSMTVQSTQTAGGKSYPRGYYPPDEGTGAASFLEKLQDPRGLVGGYTSKGAFERTLVMNEPLFLENIEAARCVLLAPHRIPLKEFTCLGKKPETKGGLHPV
ncbi:unnamed protein product [Phytophthora fragariaefolia]|uniref:Unnamed protein product n=1 Tax=Phytophthora fragariaefolia TaxID=1490495 RepID=A0A9W6U542_9STRA|nr:unnamed protein product [Phytophthora fragariaefolia]